MKKCPYCAEEIQDAAIVCRYCGRDLATGAPPVAAPPVAQATTVPAKGSSTDPGLLAFGLTLISLALMVFVLPAWVVIVLTAVWAAWDSSQVELTRYRSGISLSPVVLFIGICLLWIIAFPWYVVVRQKIQRGTQPLK